MIQKVIAWIEDDADEIDVVVKPLVSAGFEFKYYYTYSDALERLDDIRKCDLILFDLVIPTGSTEFENLESEEYVGRDLLRRFRGEFNIELPIIVLSSFVDLPNVFAEGETEKLRVVPLSKPIRPSRLKTEVYKLLGLEEE